MRLSRIILATTLCVSLLSPATVFAGPGADTAEDIGVYFEPAGSFFFRNTLDTGGVDAQAFISPNAGFIQIAGDWDGDGDDGIGIYDTTTGGFFLVDTVSDSPGAPLASDYSFFLATDGANWLPIAGDWDGVGGDGVGIYNTTSGAMFLVDDATATGGVAVASDYSLFMSPDGANHLPLAGAWNGAANDGVGIYNTTSGTMFLADNANVTGGAFVGADETIFIDPAGANYRPVAGDWNDNGSDGVGIFSTTSGAFFLVNDATQGPGAAAPTDITASMIGSVSPLGGAGYLPVTGYWGLP